MQRRTFLAAATASAGVLAGCTGGGGGGGDSETATAQPTPSYSADDVREEARAVEYDELFRNFEEYQDAAVYFQYAQVYQTVYEDNYTYTQINVSNDDQSWSGDIAAWYYGDRRVLEEDFMEFWGVVERLYEYETVDGGVRTIPGVTLVDYALRDTE